jgi:hypothetical protein
MSWSLGAAGKPAAVKVKLQQQFEQAKKNVAHIAHEVKTVELAEQLVNSELDFLAESTPPGVVTVSASGSASTYTPRSSQVMVNVQPIYGFVE